MLYPAEEQRIRYVSLPENGGELIGRRWCLNTARIYRKALLAHRLRPGSDRHYASYPEWREKFIRSYLDLKRYGLGGPHPLPPVG